MVFKEIKEFWKTWILFLVPLALLPILWIDPENIRAMRCLYILALMGAYWMFQALPLPITSLLPIVAFPLAQIASTADVCRSYFNATMFMFIGGLIMAIGIEASRLAYIKSAWQADNKIRNTYMASIAKCLAGDVANKVRTTFVISK